ncbi:MAG: hypothetical protein LBU58_00755, partial [Clostridiales bacterium]|nr:hypothetical protein [Clostridiales bacterium]
QAAYLTLRLVGKEADAESYTGTSNFNDVGHLYDGGQRRTAYLKAHSAQYGWEGDGTNRLMPDDKVTAQQFYKVLLTVLGYQANVDYPYENTLDYAERLAGMSECSSIRGSLINDDIAVMLVEALLAQVRNETYTLAEFLAEEGVINYNRAVELGVIARSDVIEPAATPTTVPTPTPPPSALSDVAVNTVNFAEIDVVFNQPIDGNSIDLNYIKIDDASLNQSDVVSVLDDGVTLRIYREAGFVTQQGARRTLSLSKLRSRDGSREMGAIYKRELTFYDNQTPSLLEVQAIGLRRVRLVFSEPIRTSDSAVKNYATYKFNGRVMPASDAAVVYGREVYLNFSSPLEAGNNKLTIDTNRIYDLAGFPIYDVKDRDFTAEEDRTPPDVVSVDAYREQVVVTFSEEVRDQVRLYWLDGSVRKAAQSAVKRANDRSTIVFSFNEGQYLPISATEIVIEAIVDMNGNARDSYRTSVSPKFDSVRPTVVSVESAAANEVVVEFSKAVKLGAANNGRFTLKNSNNVSLTLNVQTYTPTGASGPDARYIRLTGSIPEGTYTLTVANVEDTTAQANKSVESSHSVTVRDKAPPQITSVSARISESKVVLVFNKQLEWASSTEPANYEYFSPGRGHIMVPSGTTAFLEGDGRTVVLTFPQGGWVVGGNTTVPNAFSLYIATNNTDELRVLNVADTFGNRMDPTLVDVPGTNEVAAKLLPTAYAVTTQRVMLRFEPTGALPINAASADFIVRAGSQNLPFRSMGYNSISTSARELYIDLDGFDLNPDATYSAAHTPVTVSMVLASQVTLTKTALGTPLEIQNGAILQLTDGIKPGLLEQYRGNRAAALSQNLSGVMLPQLTRDQVLVVFDERVQLFGITSAAQLVNILDIKTENQPGSSMSPSQYTVEAYNEQYTPSSLSGNRDTRMLLVTFTSQINEAVNVSVRANTLWDGNYDANGLNVLNNAFETGYLAPTQ